jgi:diketogulonate reductase-like aldo/keto reductase
VKAHIDAWLARIKAAKMDLVMLPVAGDPTWLAALKDEKTAGRVRYIGVQTIAANFQSAQLELLMRNEPIDFIGVDYDVSNRGVEDKILPLALERKIGVMAFFPFGNAGGLSCTGGTSLFSRTANKPLPAWAADFDAKTWAQFFAKYVISHPAVTVARVGTSKATHMLDNIGGGIGRLPNETTRKRMAELVDSLPSVSLAGPPPSQVMQGPPGAIVLSAAILDRYVGEYKTAAGTSLIFRRYGTLMTAKSGTDPETVIYAVSDTRFSLGPNFIEFQRDSAGRVNGLTLEQRGQKIAASRIR